MIKYALLCDRDHAFESWFRDSAAYDALTSHGQLACPSCGSAAVRKALMAPSLARGAAASLPAGRDEEQAPRPVAMLGERERQLRAMVRDLHRKIAETSENVGPAFPDEARRIHQGEAPARSIHGQATGAEVKALIEDGVPLLPVPTLPDEHN